MTSLATVAQNLFLPGGRIAAYCIRMWVIALIPSVLLVGAAFALLWLLNIDRTGMARSSSNLTLTSVLSSVVLAPLAETALLVGLVRMVSKTIAHPSVVAAIAASVFGLLHGLVAALWFFGTIWSFFVYAYAYLRWKSVTRSQAWIIAAVPHALVNLTATALLYFLGTA